MVVIGELQSPVLLPVLHVLNIHFLPTSSESLDHNAKVPEQEDRYDDMVTEESYGTRWSAHR